MQIKLTLARARAIMKAADTVWSEMDEQANDPEWRALIQEIKDYFPGLAKDYKHL
jgi:hypothetical protein